MIWKVPEAHGDRVIRIKTEGAVYPSVFSPGADIDKNVWGGGENKMT